jgi:DNA-directed RNA polymerase subunit RPC12/RpoP
MFATDYDEMLAEFLDEAVPCEAYPEKPEHESDIYVKVVCPHCQFSILWATCRPCWVTSLAAVAKMTKTWVCKSCKNDVKLLDHTSVVGPVR